MISMIVHGSYRDERNCVSHSLHVSQWISRLSYSIGCPKSQSLARLREIAKINTRKIVAIPKSQNFVLANNSNNKVSSSTISHSSAKNVVCLSFFFFFFFLICRYAASHWFYLENFESCPTFKWGSSFCFCFSISALGVWKVVRRSKQVSLSGTVLGFEYICSS